MKVLAINGSSRKDGNTAIVLNTILNELESFGIETELIQLFDKKVGPCKACFTCGGKNNCTFNDDNFNEIFDKMKEADGIILGSPTYSANISSRMQALLERCSVVADMNSGLFARKIGASVSVGRRGGLLNAIDTLNHFFLNHEMFIVGSSYWNIAYGKMIGDVKTDEEGIQTMKNLSKNMCFALEKINKN